VLPASTVFLLFTSGRLGIIIPLQGLQVWNPNMSPFFLPGYSIFFVYIRQAGDFYPFAGTPSLEPKYEHTHTQTDPDWHPAFHWSIGSHF
jgi:hypothetical protein